MNHAVASAPVRTLRSHRRSAGQGTHRPQPLRPLAAALLLAGCATPLSGLAQAQNRSTLPSGMTVVQGQASATTQGSQLTVTNSANALLNWQSFSIGSGASVRFVQPGADSRVLNRVVGNDPSQIFGQLSSNGQVWLLNANGVLFGREARVDVAGLVASTLNLLPADWQAGRLLLREAGGSASGASVVNQGELRSTLGGHVLLIGGAGGVRNEGLIEAPGGTVGLAAGRSVELADSRTPNIVLRIDAAQGSTVTNIGTLLAAGGQVDVAAAIVNQSGIVRADSLTTTQGSQAGRVTLRGSEAVTLGAGSVTSADGLAGASAGQVLIDGGAAGLTQVAGQVNARSGDGGHGGDSRSGRGGRIEILGERVALLDSASADVSGRAGGGDLFIGGGALGREPTIRNAQASYVAGGARLTADATEAGDGGHIVVWGNESTRAYGHFSARGGNDGGNGGLVETSGGWLDARPASMRSDAPRGRAGQWLLDPYDLTITDAANLQPASDQNVNNALDPPTRYFQPNGSPSVLTSETIAAALNSGSNVYVSTAATNGNASGQITIDKAHIAVTPSQAVSLSVVASGDLLMSNSRIASSGQPLDIAFSAGSAVATANVARTIRFSSSSIDTAGPAYAGGTRGVIDLSAAYLEFTSGTSLTSQAGGNAITAHQGAASNLVGFTNAAGATALNAPKGRWLLYLSSPIEGYVGDGLAHGATIYGTTYPAAGTPDLPGSNLLLYSLQPTLYRTGTGSAISRSYDGSTRVIVSDSGQIGGMVNGDRIVGFFPDANAGSGKTIDLFPGGALAQGIDSIGKPVYGYDGGVISLAAAVAANPFTLSGSITPQALTLSGATVANRVYDGSTAASLSGGSLSGLIGSETLQLDGSFAFATANAGTAKAVSGTATLANGSNGGLAANYTLTNPGVTTTATITPRPVTLSGVTAADKTYDGGTVATVSGGTLSGLVAGEQLSLQSSGQFDNRNAGTGKTVTASTTLADGPIRLTAEIPAGLASNYQLTNPTSTSTAAINPRSVSVAGATAEDKLYDGSSAATITAWRLANLIEGDQVSVAAGQASFADPAVGNAKPVRGTALSLGGADGGNYRLNADGSTATTQASILPNLAETRNVLKPPPMPPMERPATPTDGRALDATGAMTFDASGHSTFNALDLANLPTDRIAAILETRQRYKESAFADALQQLEVDPNLADAPACLTIEQSHSGACLVTSELKAAAGPREQAAVAAPPAGPAAAAIGTQPPATPATPQTVPTQAAPAPAAPAPADAAAPRPPAIGRPTPRLAALPQIQRKIALVIGIDHYADARIPSLDGALKDANAVADVFAGKLGYETVVIQDASREAIFRALNRLALQARPEDSVLIYYAGHGDLIEKTRIGYWIPANASVDRPQTWISNNDIGRLLSLISASQVALVSDSCFSGSLIAGDALRSTSGEADPSTLLRHRSAVVMSSGGNEPVADTGKNGHSPFAWNLMRNLEKVASWRPGSNVFEQVRQAVIREVPQHPRYGPAVAGRHEAGGDYLFETRQYE